jgi:uncharacterized membrane protein
VNSVERVGSVIGGGVLMAYGLRRRSVGGVLLSAVGTGLVVRGAAALGPPLLSNARGVRVQRSITVNIDPEDAYRAWCSDRGPRFARELTADAEVSEERTGERLAWRGDHHSGLVTFARAPAGRGTEIHVALGKTARGGAVVALTVARLFGRGLEPRVAEELREFKQRLETGEVPTTTGQPAGAGR